MTTLYVGPSLSAIVASGPVYPSRFVSYGATDFEVTATANLGMPCGVSQAGAAQAPTDENYNGGLAVAGNTGDLIGIYGPSRTCLLELGSTVTAGQTLGPMSDGSGRGVYVHGGVDFGAIATCGGNSGDLIPVVVTVGEAA